MKKWTLLLTTAALVAILAGCGPSNGTNGMTIQEQQNAIDRMARDAMEDLYRQKPEARAQVENSAGVGIFSNAGAMVVFVGAGGGYGVVVDNQTNNKTYMKMATGGVGLGLGARDYRQFLIFNDQETMNRFITRGWDFGGQAGAAAKAGQSGRAIEDEGSFRRAVTIYTLTQSGLIAEASLTGTKYWVDDELNEITVRPAQD
jgi:lipid-binding SYLF domain-containing protein